MFGIGCENATLWPAYNQQKQQAQMVFCLKANETFPPIGFLYMTISGLKSFVDGFVLYYLFIIY